MTLTGDLPLAQVLKDFGKQTGNALIDRLHALITSEDMIYRHEWEVGDLLMWDNSMTQHLAISDYALPLRRLMHRVTVNGTVPI